jgi:hypothetical protein
VSGFQQRFEPGGKLVWDFRVERLDAAGKPLPRVAVEMRAATFVGSINNGDTVEVPGVVGENGILMAERVRNLTSSATVTAGPAETRAEAGKKEADRRRRSFARFMLVLLFCIVGIFLLRVVSGI